MSSIADTRIAAPVDWQSPAMKKRRARRYAMDRVLKGLGLSAIVAALGFLFILFASLTATGYKAFVQTMVTVEIALPAGEIDRADPSKANWRKIVRDALAGQLDGISKSDERDYFAMFTSSAQYLVRDEVMANPSMIGTTASFSIPMSDPLDQLAKGEIGRDLPEERRRVNDRQIAWFDALSQKGLISQPFNKALLFNADSRFPELAGLAGAISGSFWVLLVCFLISFPMGIAAAVYLEEFAPKNRVTDLIEVNINNLAAVPSVVFGLLGLAVFLGWFGLPRSAPLVGGMVLALMTLPTLIIVTRAALKQVPQGIREAALGVGASKHETILHHVLPLSMPSVLTGTIIGLAQALGETAPLLLIGMNAFITSPPDGVMEASTALPTQIFIWADSPERGFVARTSAAILVLLAFLVTMNAIAVLLRQRLQRRW
ncbi:MAG: phosphate ABC transporter permease PstA [Anderseniella sp.]|jgi:phosphate transport system permease protein|nr:phosphate ABC transporter permease PstA [Anderseniella sp.]